MSNEFEATIRRLASEAAMGNEMIARGDNSKASHMAAWEEAAETADDFAAAYNAARDMGSSVIVNSRCAALRIVAYNWKGTRAEFLDAAYRYGINTATAATQWNKGRKA